MARPTTTDDARFPRAHRLRSRRDFRRVQSVGRRVHTPHFIVLVDRGRAERTRLGITVSRKVGGAVVRNRVKRLVREVFRANRERFQRGHDLVVIAKRHAGEVDFTSARRELLGVERALANAARALEPTGRPC